MIYITEKAYDKKHTDYRGVFENLQNHQDMQHLVGKKTMLLPNNGGLGIETVSFEIVENFEQNLITKDGTQLVYLYTDDWHRPIFQLTLPSGKKVKVVFLEEGIRVGKPMYSYTSEGEPDCPLKEQYQVEVLG